jgi:hypothetical protein
MLSDTDVKKRAADMEEGDIGEESDAAIAEESGESLTRVKSDPRDLVKLRTCFMGRSLMTQADLDALRLEGCFEPGVCRLPSKETMPKPKKNESFVFRDFFTVGLRLLVSKRFADILAAYNIQIHQLTPNSIPQIMKFLWAYRTFVGDNDVETFIRHFEIHWAKRVITVENEEQEGQYGCCTFQTRRISKSQAPVELAPAYKNKWANRWTSYWFYATIQGIGRNSNHEEVTTYDLASRMIDLDVDLSPELTKASRTYASTSAFFQATHVITTRDAFEEFVATDIWPCQPRWGSWAFKVQKLHGLDCEVRSPKFNVKKPDGKIDEEIVAEVEKKVVQMIGNYTHKEWECAQKILKHQGRVNRVFDEMNVSFSSRLIPSTTSKKMQPAGNIGSEKAETSKKRRASKAAATVESTSKGAKATDVLVQCKVEVDKTTLPPVAEKTTKLMKVTANLVRRQTDATKVAAAEREKKKAMDAAPLTVLEKKTISKRKNPSAGGKDKEIVNENPQSEPVKPQAKKQKVEKVSEGGEMLMRPRRLRFSPPPFTLRGHESLKNQKTHPLKFRLILSRLQRSKPTASTRDCISRLPILLVSD